MSEDNTTLLRDALQTMVDVFRARDAGSEADMHVESLAYSKALDALALTRTEEPPTRTVVLPPASPEDTLFGWTLSYPLMLQIASRVRVDHEAIIGMEEAEAVLLAAAEISPGTEIGDSDALKGAIVAVLENESYQTSYGTYNCRFCDLNLDDMGTGEDMHSADCLIHTLRSVLDTTTKETRNA